ncbi:MAG: hypothetical protein ABIG34_03290 [Candidatus Peregrinibacteria bacterium]
MVVLVPQRAPDGTPVFVNSVEGKRAPEELAARAEAARNAHVTVNHATGEVRRLADGALLRHLPSKE